MWLVVVLWLIFLLTDIIETQQQSVTESNPFAHIFTSILHVHVVEI